MPGAVRVAGIFGEEVAERALRAIIERHEPLRTVFEAGEDGPLQRVRRSFDFHLGRIDLCGLTEEWQERAVQEVLSAEAAKPFDLGSDLMLRAAYIRLGEEKGVLLFDMHHIASDGWSMNILVKEFCELYEAFLENRPNPLPPLPIRYTDYAHWQRDWLRSENFEHQISYWKKQLDHLPAVHGLPLDRPRPPVQTFAGAQQDFKIDLATVVRLREVANNSKATVYMVLHGIFALLIARHSGRGDIVIGTAFANRTAKEVESLVGFFVNTLLLRTQCSGRLSFREYLTHIRTVHVNAQANQDVPFDYLVERLNPSRSANVPPLLQIFFTMNTTEASQAKIKGLVLEPLKLVHLPVKFDLILNAVEQVDGLILRFEYNCDLFDRPTIIRIGEHFVNLAAAIASNPDADICEVPLATVAEKEPEYGGLQRQRGRRRIPIAHTRVV